MSSPSGEERHCVEMQLFCKGGGCGVAHIAASLPKNTESDGDAQTHRHGHNQCFRLSICYCSAAPFPAHLSPCTREMGQRFCGVFSERRSVCFCLCLFLLHLSVLSIPIQPTPPFSPFSQLVTALAFSAPPPASHFPPRVFPSLSLFSAGNLKLSSLFPAPTLYHASSLHGFSQSRIPL